MPINVNGKLRIKGATTGGNGGGGGTEFISVWDTTLGDGSPSIILPLVASGNYNFSVNWGDGNTDTITAYDQAEVTHTYATGGEYTIIITGTIEGWSFNYDGDCERLTSITNIGQLKLGNEVAYFAGCTNLTTIGGVFDLTGTTNFNGMFDSCTSLTSVNGIESWDTSAVTSMSAMFAYATAFNQDISGWNTSAVTSMASMFEGTTTFNQPLNSWDVSSVTDMNYMFGDTVAFNQPLNSWDTSAVTNMGGMFYQATLFNGDISGWDTSAVTDMNYMFGDTVAFNQDISGWDVSSVTDMNYMFGNATSFNQPLNSWDTSAVTNMGGMFQNTSFNQDISGWNTAAVTTMESMFEGATAFNQDISGWDVSSVNLMGGMFINATSFNQPLNSWDVSNVTDMGSMFYNATSFNQNLNGWDVSAVTNMGSFMDGKSTADYDYYDDLLNAWSLLTLQNGVEWGMGSIEYTSAGATARQDIIDNYSWTITDGGEYSPTYTFKTTQIGGTNIAQIYTTTGYIKFNSTVYLVNDEITYTLDNPNGEYALVSCDEFGTPSGDITTLTFANSNQLTSFDGTGLSGLTTLSLGTNQLTSFDGTELINLTGLNLIANGLSSLSGFTLPPNLLSLELNDNELISFDVSGLPNLVSLVLTLNPLEASDNDLILSQFDINGVTIDSAGVIPGFFTSGGRTSASDTAYNNLISKGWYIEGADLI
jgi:surface protein